MSLVDQVSDVSDYEKMKRTRSVRAKKSNDNDDIPQAKKPKKNVVEDLSTDDLSSGEEKSNQKQKDKDLVVPTSLKVTPEIPKIPTPIPCNSLSNETDDEEVETDNTHEKTLPAEKEVIERDTENGNRSTIEKGNSFMIHS